MKMQFFFKFSTIIFSIRKVNTFQHIIFSYIMIIHFVYWTYLPIGYIEKTINRNMWNVQGSM